MELEPVTAGMGIVSLITGYLVYDQTGLNMGVIVFLLTYATLFMALKAGVVNSLAAVTNPFVTFFIVLTVAFIRFALLGDPFWPAAGKALGLGFLGGAVSMMVFNYWNIGG